MAVQLGTIELAFYRVHRRLLRVPLPISKIPLFTTVDQTSEKILKGKAIDNNIRLLCADSHGLTLAKSRLDPLIHTLYLNQQPTRTRMCVRTRLTDSQQCSDSITAPIVSIQTPRIYNAAFNEYRGPPNPRLHSSKRVSGYSDPTRRGGRDEPSPSNLGFKQS